MPRQLSRSEIKKFIMEAKQQSFVNEESLWDTLKDYAVPDFIEDKYRELKKEGAEALEKYFTETVSEFLVENVDDIASNAPFSLDWAVKDVIMSTHKEMGNCAGKIAMKYLSDKSPF
jgi:hypothetical protein